MSRNHWWSRWSDWLLNLLAPVDEHRQLKKEIRDTVNDTHEANARVRNRLAAVQLSIRSHRHLADIERLEEMKRHQENP